MTLALLGNALVLAFVACCVGSAVLQIVAWAKHARRDAPVSFRTFWRPEGHFDEIGTRQIRLARRLLLVGGIAYLSFGATLILSAVLQRGS